MQVFAKKNIFCNKNSLFLVFFLAFISVGHPYVTRMSPVCRDTVTTRS